MPAGGDEEDYCSEKLNFYNIDAFKIAQRWNGQRINTIMQVAFFKVAGVMDEEKALAAIEESIHKTDGRKGASVVQKNIEAVKRAAGALEKIDYPASWAEATEGAVFHREPAPQYVQEYVYPILDLKGDQLPVSALSVDGTVPTGTTRYEKRGIAIQVPVWIPSTASVQPVLLRLPSCRHQPLLPGKRTSCAGNPADSGRQRQSLAGPAT